MEATTGCSCKMTRRFRGRALCHWWSQLAGVVVGGAFLLSAIPHLMNPYCFLASIYDYELVDARLGVGIATVLPFLQLLLAGALLGHVFVDGALLVSMAMLAGFFGVQASALQRHMDISCGCWGPTHTGSIGITSISTVGALLLVSITGLLCRQMAHVRTIGGEHTTGISDNIGV